VWPYTRLSCPVMLCTLLLGKEIAVPWPDALFGSIELVIPKHT